MRIPSSAKTTAATGRMQRRTAATASCAWSMTSGSVVNARGMTSASASRTPPMTQPGRERPARSSAARRRRASSASPAPSARPTMHLPGDRDRVEHEREEDEELEGDLVGGERRRADARAAPRWRARSTRSSAAGAHEELARRSHVSERMRARSGGASAPARAAAATANAAPIPSWAITVPAAEPSRPQSEAVDEQQLEHDVRRRWPTTTMTSGVRRSPTPRSQPWPASAISATAGRARAMRR